MSDEKASPQGTDRKADEGCPVAPGSAISRMKMSRASGFAAGSDESYTTSPDGPRTVSSQQPNASAIPRPGL